MRNRITTTLALVLVFFSFLANAQNIEKKFNKALQKAFKSNPTREQLQAIHDYYMPSYEKYMQKNSQKTKHIGIA